LWPDYKSVSGARHRLNGITALPSPAPSDVEVCSNERLDRFLTGTVTALPILALGVVVWQVWGDFLRWSDIAVFAIMYLITVSGITVGFHRLFTHRAYKTGPRTRVTLAIMGSMAIEGPITAWVADHRKHHVFTDVEGDPHSPHVGHGGGLKGALRGLLHAHVGWLFIHTQRGAKDRYAKDLLNDPLIRWVDRWFFVWVLLGLAMPFALGWLIGGSFYAALTGLLWGGAVRMLVVHHLTYSINSLCHFFGRRRFETGDESRNLAWLAPLAFGEGWHNNHHAFPTSAHHGMTRREKLLDPSAWVIGAMEKLGLAWDVVRVSPEKQAAKAAA
jgi:stearoyl-CoA desaturase (delta-9 desaturase)